jgi:hypothetical protein
METLHASFLLYALIKCATIEQILCDLNIGAATPRKLVQQMWGWPDTLQWKNRIILKFSIKDPGEGKPKPHVSSKQGPECPSWHTGCMLGLILCALCCKTEGGGVFVCCVAWELEVARAGERENLLEHCESHAEFSFWSPVWVTF